VTLPSAVSVAAQLKESTNLENDAADLYLDLLKGCLTRMIFPDSYVNREFRPTGFFDPDARRNGRDWPSEAETMVGLKRLDNLKACITSVLRDGIPGDLVETGVWRGGAAILMRAVLKALGDRQRLVWAVDSFAGLPKPDSVRYPEDAEDRLWQSNDYLGVGLEKVQSNFARYGLLDGQVRFLKGWFKDTLPQAPISEIAVLRLDGDMYESTMDVLNNLYGRVSRGGYIIVDDYGALKNCKSAVDDFRSNHQITEPLQQVDWTGVYWRHH
jgi:hypothetical protein